MVGKPRIQDTIVYNECVKRLLRWCARVPRKMRMIGCLVKRNVMSNDLSRFIGLHLYVEDVHVGGFCYAKTVNKF